MQMLKYNMQIYKPMQVSNKEVHCAKIKEQRKEREAHGTFMSLEINGVFCQVTHKETKYFAWEDSLAITLKSFPLFMKPDQHTYQQNFTLQIIKKNQTRKKEHFGSSLSKRAPSPLPLCLKIQPKKTSSLSNPTENQERKVGPLPLS